jgi:hypothetical protein
MGVVLVMVLRRRLLSAALRHQDAQARLVDLFDAGDLGPGRHDVGGLQVDHGGTVLHDLGAVGGDADEGDVERIVAERRHHRAGVLELD